MRKLPKQGLKSNTVSTSYFVGAFEFAQRLAEQKKLDLRWLTPYQHKSKQSRVSASDYQELLEIASVELDEPCFGLKYGQQVDIASLSLLGYLAMASATLKEASKAVNQYGSLVSEVGLLESENVELFTEESSRPFVNIYWRPKPGNEHCSTQIIDGVLAGWVSFGWQFIGEKKAIHSVHLSERNVHKSTYQEYFGCPVELGCKENFICIERRYFEQALCQAEPMVHQAIQQRASLALLEIEEQSLLVSEYISQLLPNLILSHCANIEHIAKLLNTTQRSLQRTLSQENINFRQLLDQARHSLAVELLQEKQLPISHIGGIIGFNDQSSFNRAFKRWTGMTPKQFQQ